MEDYKKGAHPVWDYKYHLVWMTKSRYEVLSGDVGLRCRELLREIARSKDMTKLTQAAAEAVLGSESLGFEGIG